MADIWSKRKRSEVMSKVRGRGNKDTELALAKLFRRQCIWRRRLEGCRYDVIQFRNDYATKAPEMHVEFRRAFTGEL